MNNDLVNSLHPFQNIGDIGKYIAIIIVAGLILSIGLVALRSWLRR